MEKKELRELSDEELLERAKELSKSRTTDAVLFGLFIGIAIYSTINRGFGLLSLLPLLYIPVARQNNLKRAEIQEIMEERGLSPE